MASGSRTTEVMMMTDVALAWLVQMLKVWEIIDDPQPIPTGIRR